MLRESTEAVLYDEQAIRDWWSVKNPNSEVHEVWIAFPSDANCPPKHGYFDSVEELIARLYAFRSWSGCYWTLNAVARKPATNRFEVCRKRTCDADIDKLTGLVIDFDVKSKGKHSATAIEKKAARDKADTVAKWLMDEFGFCLPDIVDSGNGYHAYHGINLPATHAVLIREFLTALHHKFSDSKDAPVPIKIDTQVGTPGTLIRLPGTMACKGESTAERPHRMAAIDAMPDLAESLVTAEQLQAVIDAVDIPKSEHSEPVEINRDRAGDDYSATAGIFDELLPSLGWEQVSDRYWRHPDASHAQSASVVVSKSTGIQLLYMFTDSFDDWGLPAGGSYPAFSVLALLKHDGNFKATASILRREGYGQCTVDFSEFEEDWEPKEYTKEDIKVPKHLLRVGGIMGNYMRYVNDVNYKLQPDFSMAGAISLLGSLLDGKVRDTNGNYSNAYIVAIGESGIGKNRIVDTVQRLLAQNSRYVTDGISSHPAAVKALSDGKGACTWLADEFQVTLTEMRNEKNYKWALKGTLCNAFSNAASPINEVKSDRNVTAPGRHINLLATATPALYNSLCLADVESGLLPRMLLFRGNDMADLQDFEGDRSAIPEKLIDACSHLAEQLESYSLSEPLVVHSDKSAIQMLRRFQLVAEERRRASQLKELWARAAEKAYRLALIHAVNRCGVSDGLTITNRDAIWAISFAEWNTQLLDCQLSENLADSWISDQINKLLAFIKNRGGRVQHSEALRHLRLDAAKFKSVVETASQTKQIKVTRKEDKHKTSYYSIHDEFART